MLTSYLGGVIGKDQFRVSDKDLQGKGNVDTITLIKVAETKMQQQLL